MKRIITLMLTFLMALSLCACSNNEPDETNDPATTPNQTVQQGIELEGDGDNVTPMNEVNEETIIAALTERGYENHIITQNVAGQDNAKGMSSWSGTVINMPAEEGSVEEAGVGLYCIAFNFGTSTEDAETKLAQMRQMSGDFEIFMADIENNHVIVIGGNEEYVEDAMALIELVGYIAVKP